MYYSYVEIEYIATSFSPARTDLALKLLRDRVPISLLTEIFSDVRGNSCLLSIA
jgi:hypothetical protein